MNRKFVLDWQRTQAAACPCRGADDWCPCQNVERKPINTMESERRVAFPGPGNKATPIHAVDEPCDDSRESRVKR